jgi:parallel beta-helix repeat protein
MRRVSGLLVVTLVAGLLAFAGPANASETIWVHHGQSIQAAVHRAHPGDKIVVLAGEYHQTVQIRKNDITLRGRHAVIVPPSSPHNFCTQVLGPSGICFLAPQLDTATGAVITPLQGGRVSGFTVRGFDGNGIMAYGTHGVVIRHNRALDNAEYGVVSFVSSHNKFIDNEATGAGEAGFYYGDSPNADAYIHGNTAHDNLFGIFIRNSMHGVVSDNDSYENCIGTLFLAGAPGPDSYWTYKYNHVWDNDKACPGNEEAPPLSGIGVLLSGTDHVRVVHNWIKGNHPTGPSPISGGVIVITSIAAPVAPVDNEVEHNVIRGNKPFDIVYDGTGSGNDFADNWCALSVPAGLCS